jgi:hypothetical protein
MIYQNFIDARINICIFYKMKQQLVTEDDVLLYMRYMIFTQKIDIHDYHSNFNKFAINYVFIIKNQIESEEKKLLFIGKFLSDKIISIISEFTILSGLKNILKIYLDFCSLSYSTYVENDNLYIRRRGSFYKLTNFKFYNVKMLKNSEKNKNNFIKDEFIFIYKYVV